MLLNCGVGEDSWESLGPQEIQPVNPIHWKDWCWSWNSNTLATWCKELTHWKRHWCWERLKAGGGDWRGWQRMRWLDGITDWIVGDGQGGLACWSLWGHKELDRTEPLNWTELIMVNYKRKRGPFTGCKTFSLPLAAPKPWSQFWSLS